MELGLLLFCAFLTGLDEFQFFFQANQEVEYLWVSNIQVRRATMPSVGLPHWLRMCIGPVAFF
jgi:hypothetical protein